MDITITGYDGENVIAQIIEDLLSVNGLCVKREDFSPIHANLSIEQLDRQLNVFKKNKVMFNIKVVKEEKPKYAPKAKLSKFKPTIPDMAGIIGRTAARIQEVRADRAIGREDNDLDELFEDGAIAAAAPRAVAAPVAVAAAPVYGYGHVYGGAAGGNGGGPRYGFGGAGGGGGVRAQVEAIGAFPIRQDIVVEPNVAANDEQAFAAAEGALAAAVNARQEQIAAIAAEAAVVHDQIRNDIAALADNQIVAQEIADEMPVAAVQIVEPQVFEYGGQWAARHGYGANRRGR